MLSAERIFLQRLFSDGLPEGRFGDAACLPESLPDSIMKDCPGWHGSSVPAFSLIHAAWISEAGAAFRSIPGIFRMIHARPPEQQVSRQ